MTHRNLIGSARFLLRDTDRQSDTSARFYLDEEIARQLTASLAAMMRELIVTKPRRSPLAIQPLFSQQVSPAWADGAGGVRKAALPSDFFLLECGLKTVAGGEPRFLPADIAPRADTFAGMTSPGVPRLYARSGDLYAAKTAGGEFEADLVYYWRRPPEIAADSDLDLTQFSDGVYNCVKYAACRDLVVKRNGSAAKRLILQKEYMAKKGMLQ